MARTSLGLSWAFGVCLAVAACGGKVVVDVPGGAGGAGGTASGTLTTGSLGQGGTAGVTVVGPGPGPVVATSGPPQAATAVVVSSSVGGSLCHDTGDCATCQECAFNGPCAAVWDKCQSFAPCIGLLQCFNSCNGDQACYEKCFANFPDAQPIYSELAICVLCQTCLADCGPNPRC